MHGRLSEAVLTLLERHERTLSSVFFLAGLASDLLTFTLLPLSYIVILFGAYLLIAALATTAAHWGVGREGTFPRALTTLGPLVAHFVLGSVLCGFLILLSQSGAFTISWPFLLLIGGVFVGNELFHTYRRHFIFQTLLIYLAIFAFFTIAVPLSAGQVTQGTFLAGAALSLAAFLAYLGLLALVRWERMRGAFAVLTLSTVLLTGVVATAHAARVIPPIPLVLRDGGVYAFAAREGDGYRLEGGAQAPWWDPRAPVVEVAPGSPLYAYTAIFAPGAFIADIVHVWQWYDPQAGRWVTRSTVAFSVSGGREEGYRGYSLKSAPEEGLWRILVQTADGQTLGSIAARVRHR